MVGRLAGRRAGRARHGDLFDPLHRERERGGPLNALPIAPDGDTKLVAHFKDGQIAKGFSRDFAPERDSFHMVKRLGPVASSQEIRLDDLKALFHVKTWGRKDRHVGTQPGFPARGRTAKRPGRSFVKTVVEFYDGEKIFGYSVDYDPNRRGFYVLPADPADNNSTIFVLTSSLVNIQFLRD